MTPQEAYYKARNLGKRTPELEGLISKDAFYSYLYAIHVIEGRWELAEAIISKNVYYSYLYAKNVIGGKFILGEPAISKDARYSYHYAIGIIKGRLPDFMHNQMILSNDEYTKEYVKFIK